MSATAVAKMNKNLLIATMALMSCWPANAEEVETEQTNLQRNSTHHMSTDKATEVQSKKVDSGNAVSARKDEAKHDSFSCGVNPNGNPVLLFGKDIKIRHQKTSPTMPIEEQRNNEKKSVEERLLHTQAN
jgi:hypothetical protein